MKAKVPAGGAFFILGYQGKEPSPEFLDLIQRFQISGIIFFERNIDSPSHLQKQINRLQKCADYPLFFMIDQEGGKINRLKKDFPLFPGNKYFGEKKDFDGAAQAYKENARQLRQLGLNVNLAPVADLSRSGADYISERSFGGEPETVGKFIRRAVKAMHSAGIFACAKHFPGLGNLRQDPHQVLPEGIQSPAEFRSADFVPFQAAIDSGVEMVMTTHVLARGLDQDNPATFSSRIVKEFLRKELKFKGLVITDDMEMGGIVNYYELPNACREAFTAGHDLILVCHTLEKQKEALESFQEKIVSGEIPAERVRESLQNIELYREKLKQNAVV